MNRIAVLTGVLAVIIAGSMRTAADEILIVVGAQGEETYGSEFREWQRRWESIAETADFEVAVIGGESESGEPSDRERLASEVGKRLDGETPLWLILVGHGTWDGISARFNLVGPDLSARELAKWIRPVRRPLVIVNNSSSSGPFIDRLSGPNRVIVTATKSGSEQNYARFGGFFANAIGELASDLDHDDAVSVREAFLKAATETGLFYEQEGRIATEHAMLDDNGDKKGTRVELLRGTKRLQGAGSIDGALAGRIVIPVGSDAPRLNRAQSERRDELEAQLREVRRKAGDEPSDLLRSQVLPILRQLAQIYRDAESKEAEGNDAESSDAEEYQE
ncbi:MAG: hypothetical protein AAFU85_07210 [Planctomycetota bacterium]